MITTNIECENGKVLTIDELPNGDIELGSREVVHNVYRNVTESKTKTPFIVIPKSRRALIAETLIGNV